jgi:hypothetical protein
MIVIVQRCVELCELQVHDIKTDCVSPAPYYIPHFKVHLDGRKGWQSKAGYDSPRESKFLLFVVHLDSKLKLVQRQCL